MRDEGRKEGRKVSLFHIQGSVMRGRICVCRRTRILLYKAPPPLCLTPRRANTISLNKARQRWERKYTRLSLIQESLCLVFVSTIQHYVICSTLCYLLTTCTAVLPRYLRPLPSSRSSERMNFCWPSSNSVDDGILINFKHKLKL